MAPTSANGALLPRAVRGRIVAQAVRLLGAGALLSLGISLVRFGWSLPTWCAIPFVVQLGVLDRLLRHDRQEVAIALWPVTSLPAMVYVLAAFGGPQGTAGPYVAVSALLCVVWMDPVPAGIAVAAHVLAVAASLPLETAIAGTAWATPPDFVAAGAWVALPLATAFVVGAVSPMIAALRSAEDASRAQADRSRRAAEDARRALDAKARFLATMSHELRTPLNAILGYSALLLEEEGPADPDLRRIEAEGRHLLHLVEDLLELSRAHSAPAASRPVDVARLLTDLGAEVPDPAPRTVSSDPVQLGRLLRNLVAGRPGSGAAGPGPPQAPADPDGAGRGPVRVELGEGEGIVWVAVARASDDPSVERLVTRRLAETLGGSLSWSNGRDLLTLPRSRPETGSGGGG